MRADLAQLVTTLRSLHPGLHRYRSEQAFQAQVEGVGELIAETISDLEFYRRLAPLVADVRCGHTAMRPSGPFLRSIASTAKQLPCRLRFLGERTFVLAWQQPDDERINGCELLAIDGHSMPELRARMMRSIRGDGHITTGKLRELENQFAVYYSILIDTKADQPFQLKVRTQGQSSKVLTVEGARFRPPSRPDRGAPIEWQLCEGGIGLLSVRTFSASAMRRASVDYRKFLADTFAELQRRKVRKLVVDLRGNSGGTDQMGALLVSYLCARPFGYFRSIEVTQQYTGEGEVQTTDDGRRVVTGHPGLRVQQPADNAFAGDVIVLIDGITFSTAADVASVLHYQKVGVFLGEESGGGYDGNNSGVMHTEVLEHSKIAVRVPLWKYTTAAPGHERAGRGVPAESVVVASIEDLLAGRDPLLQEALRRLRRQ